MTVLILGGTAEARLLAQALVDGSRPALSSLAGRVSQPNLPAGQVRIGGFGGWDGLRAFVTEQQISAIVDATHPFAVTISRHALLAAQLTGCPLLRLLRPGWGTHPRAADWHWVADPDQALLAAGPDVRRPFLTTGRQSLASFLAWRDRDVLVRVVEPPAFELPERWSLIRSRGPYDYPSERRLMLEHRVDALIAKDSGGSHTVAKLDAATDLGIAVVIIRRPGLPAGVPTVTTVAEALSWLG